MFTKGLKFGFAYYLMLAQFAVLHVNISVFVYKKTSQVTFMLSVVWLKAPTLQTDDKEHAVAKMQYSYFW